VRVVADAKRLTSSVKIRSDDEVVNLRRMYAGSKRGGLEIPLLVDLGRVEVEIADQLCRFGGCQPEPSV
jgi:hypothetical protein